MATAFKLVADDSLENGDAPRQISPLHYQRWKDANGVLACSQHEQAFFPTPFDDLVRRVYHVQPPDVPRPTDGPHFSRAPRNRGELLSEPCSIFTNGRE